MEFLPILDSLASGANAEGLNDLYSDLGLLLGASLDFTRSKTVIPSYLKQENTTNYLFFLAGLFKGMDENPNVRDKNLNVQQLPENKRKEWVAELSEKALSDTVNPAERVQAVRLLGYFPSSDSDQLLIRLLVPHQPVEIQLAAMEALSQLDPMKVGKVLTQAERWKTYTPRVKASVLNKLFQHPALLEQLIVALETGAIAPLPYLLPAGKT